MNSINEESLLVTQEENLPESKLQSIKRERPISVIQRQEVNQMSGAREVGQQLSRRNKISPKKKEMYIQGLETDDLSKLEHSEKSQEQDRDVKVILDQRRKFGSFDKELPDVLRQEEKREKKRFTAMLEAETVDFLQELKTSKKIRSVSGLLETAIEEFMVKYQLKK